MTILTQRFIAAVKAKHHQEIERLLEAELLAPTNGNPHHERSY
jgi:hypothetical protein